MSQLMQCLRRIAPGLAVAALVAALASLGVSLTSATTPAPAATSVLSAFDALRPATFAEAETVREIKDMEGLPAANNVYVAVTDIEAALPQTPMTILLANPLRWKAGPLGQVVLITLPDVSLESIKRSGTLFSDPMCDAERIGIATGVCLNATAQRPGDWDEMLTHMRRPTLQELRQWMPTYETDGIRLDETDTLEYYVATSDFTVAPEYRFYTDPLDTLGIFVPEGVKVLGGQLGFMDLYPLTGGVYLDGNFIGDSICFMYDSPDTWSETFGLPNVPNVAKPSKFAPESELKRVSRCLRG
jgi:hypothetical protein